MSEQTAEGKAAESPADLRGTLITRLAVAGLLVAVLLAVLAFFDYLASSDEPEPVVYTKPIPVAPKKEVSQPVTPVAALPEPPEKPALPAAEPPPPAEAAAQPAAASPSAPPPAPPSAAKQHSKPLRPAAEVAAAAKAPAAPVAEAAAPVSPRGAGEAPAAPPQPAAPRIFSGFMLQAGVFSNVQRAEELHAKLALNGIPSTLEARVQVGPFKTRAEADAAREKLTSLGIAPVLVPPRTARR